ARRARASSRGSWPRGSGGRAAGRRWPSAPAPEAIEVAGDHARGVTGQPLAVALIGRVVGVDRVVAVPGHADPPPLVVGVDEPVSRLTRVAGLHVIAGASLARWGPADARRRRWARAGRAAARPLPAGPNSGTRDRAPAA